jgi:hypothetical protein
MCVRACVCVCVCVCVLHWQRLFFVTGGMHHAAVLDRFGNLYMWGSNGAGRLGLGHRGAAATPTCVEALETIAIRHVSLGMNHSAAIAAGSDDLYMWGCAAEGMVLIFVCLFVCMTLYADV